MTDTDASGEFVGLAVLPNAPIAETACSKLKENGIPAYFHATQPFLGANTVTNPGGPCRIFVRIADVERARELLSG